MMSALVIVLPWAAACPLMTSTSGGAPGPLATIMSLKPDPPMSATATRGALNGAPGLAKLGANVNALNVGNSKGAESMNGNTTPFSTTPTFTLILKSVLLVWTLVTVVVTFCNRPMFLYLANRAGSMLNSNVPAQGFAPIVNWIVLTLASASRCSVSVSTQVMGTALPMMLMMVLLPEPGRMRKLLTTLAA